MWYWLFKYVFIGPILIALGRPSIEGVENIPARGPVILASNHQAVLDSFYLPLKVQRRITFLAKSEYFTGSGVKGAFQKWFFTAVGQVPIDRTGADAAQDALNAGVRVIEKGKVLGIYPEGTRSPDGRLYKGKTGMARLALQTGVQVVPVAMIGTDKMNPIGSKVWRPAKITIKIGKPIDFSRFEGLAGNRFVERAVTDEVMYDLMLLSGQEYVDVYAASLKKTATASTEAATPVDPERVPDTRAS
ncbi:lysophospholipid acyltransferase family protein [Rhodococcus sp. P1Y]|uniref:lysophospholipid acyltransferase family protein n=1 Tax=Rhodococcus sp. P1Y TaxID=1302308 RepID=UPI000EAF93F6|nr:lysophospholipid acyltransferase family protein [Rhodococcus sp. P1Y]AYJ50013.1 1-acyl-sn-glycerol-3-phosphate acyltransferase [Rhodococcus sp. P1Y]